jgi:hypothetical protein
MKKLLDTSKKIFHVFSCENNPTHIHPGFEIAKVGKMQCPDCGKPVVDVTNTPLGKSYFAFARPDLGNKQS